METERNNRGETHAERGTNPPKAIVVWTGNVPGYTPHPFRVVMQIESESFTVEQKGADSLGNETWTRPAFDHDSSQVIRQVIHHAFAQVVKQLHVHNVELQKAKAQVFELQASIAKKGR